MNSFSGLEIGKRALAAQRFGLEVAGNNIANINTPGYARQRAEFAETAPQAAPGQAGFIGTGVAVAKIRVIREEYFDREIRNNLSRQSNFAADDTMFKRIETILQEPSEYGLDTLMDNFFRAFQDLSVAPESISRRDYVLNQAQTLTEQFNLVGSQLYDLRDQTLGRVKDTLGEANRLLVRIAEVNNQLSAISSLGTDVGGTLLNERAALTEALAKQIGPLSTNINDKGHMDVNVNGRSLVSTVIPMQLRLRETVSAAGERTLSYDVVTQSGETTGTLGASSGELASLTKNYNITLDGEDTSGGFSLAKQINDLASSFVTKVNAAASAGYGLDDLAPQNRSIFDPEKLQALNIQLSSDIKGRPRDLPISANAGTPGDNTVARAIAKLADDGSFVAGLTSQRFYSNTLNNLAMSGSDAANGLKTTSLLGNQLNAQRESIIGVNMDEEALNLIRYQRAYEAAARVIATTNDILGTLINLGK